MQAFPILFPLFFTYLCHYSSFIYHTIIPSIILHHNDNQLIIKKNDSMTDNYAKFTSYKFL